MNINASPTYESLARAARAALAAKYPQGEAAMMVRIIFEQLKGYSPTDMIIRAQEPVSQFIAGEVARVVDRILHDEPIQYIFGTSRFYGLNFKVSPVVLIPRPETEELVDLIAKRYADIADLRILDIATGSGCIAIALTRTLKFAQVEALDLSGEALAVARENAATLKARVRFSQADALTLKASGTDADSYDIIVSNPPYIGESEKAEMPANVLQHEPHMALFVPDSDPLIFYRHIARYAIDALKPEGTLWFEINPLHQAQLADMLRRTGFSNIDILPDSQKLARFAVATKPTR